MNKIEKTIIGRSEYLDLPDWGVKDVLTRVDTGARTSALHVEDLEELSRNRVRFYVIVRLKPRLRRVQVTAKVIRWAKVRSSSGHYTRRCFVETTARIGPVTKNIEVSLVSREKMSYRMLLGREALRRDFLVDVAKQHVFGGKHLVKTATKRKPKRGRKPAAAKKRAVRK